jgi:hypothetical protein
MNGYVLFYWQARTRFRGAVVLFLGRKYVGHTRSGGLGIKNLQLQGVSLRARWEWLNRTDGDRPWTGLPMLKDAKAHQIFQSFTGITVGDGKSVLFWMDRWINGLTIQEIAPEVWELVPPRKRDTRTVDEALLGNAWTEDLRGELSPSCILQCVMLQGEIIEVPRDAAVPDHFAWKGSSSGQYSAKDTYHYLCQGRERFAPAEWIWSPWAPTKCKIFA